MFINAKRLRTHVSQAFKAHRKSQLGCYRLLEFADHISITTVCKIERNRSVNIVGQESHAAIAKDDLNAASVRRLQWSIPWTFKPVAEPCMTVSAWS